MILKRKTIIVPVETSYPGIMEYPHIFDIDVDKEQVVEHVPAFLTSVGWIREEISEELMTGETVTSDQIDAFLAGAWR